MWASRTGAGLDAALDGATVVIDVSNTTALRLAAATAFFETGTRNLLAAGQRAGVAHHVLLSIVGIDRLRMGYYAAKLDQEALVRGSGVRPDHAGRPSSTSSCRSSWPGYPGRWWPCRGCAFSWLPRVR